MRKIIFTIIVLSPLLIIISCSAFDDHYYNLKSEELFAFEVADTLIYTSDSNASDSFVVKSLNTAYDKYDKQYFYQYQQVSLKKVGDTLKKNYSFNNYYYSFGVYWHNMGGQARLEEVTPVELTINEKIIKKAYEISKPSNSAEDIVKIYHTYHYGVVQYEKANGEVFKLNFPKE